MDVTATSVYRAQGGPITEHWGEIDFSLLVHQPGFVSIPGAEGRPEGALISA